MPSRSCTTGLLAEGCACWEASRPPLLLAFTTKALHFARLSTKPPWSTTRTTRMPKSATSSSTNLGKPKIPCGSWHRCGYNALLGLPQFAFLQKLTLFILEKKFEISSVRKSPLQSTWWIEDSNPYAYVQIGTTTFQVSRNQRLYDGVEHRCSGKRTYSLRTFSVAF